jgi:hypothetical protein
MNEKNKIIVFLSVVAILFISIFFLARSAPRENQEVTVNPNSNSSIFELDIPQTTYDFKNISMKNGNVSTTFTIINPKEEDINLQKVFTSCMCTVAYVIGQDGNKKGPFGMPGHGAVPKVNEIIKAGESRDIEIIYDPNAHGPAGVGMISRFVYLEDAKGNRRQLEIRANVTP